MNWDETTRSVVMSRLGRPRPLRFFSEAQEPVARCLVNRLLAQDDEPRVPVIERIDERLAERRGDGYRYEEMPEDWDAWEHTLKAIDYEAAASFGVTFPELSVMQQLDLVEKVRTCKGDWHGLPAKRVFELWMRYACEAYYCHPWAWNEIGFGGPAYPRGYKNLGIARREPWEVEERDASDPIPWTERVDKARAAHESGQTDRPDR